MKPHDTFLELAATSIDFPLAPADRGRLEHHLDDCPACRRTATALRGDAMALASLPPVLLPERRAAAILDSALHPAAFRNPVRLVVVAALLGLLLLGSLAVGSELLRRMDDDDLSVVLPVPSMTVTPDAKSSPMPGAPTGTLAVTHGDGDTAWIELVTMDGAVTRLAEGRDPAWLSAERIVYTCPAAGEMPTGICVIDVGSPGEPQLLVAGADRPSPAPDGRSIAFHRGMTDVGETWVMGADGSDPRLVHTGDFHLWSPDGAWLAGQPESAGYEVAVVGADGQGFQVLAPGYDPAWSPTGDRITYVAVDEAGASIRNVYPHDGEVEPLVTEPADTSLSAPAWVANGRRLYVRDGDLWMFDSAQSRTLRVTDGLAIPGGAGMDPLAISPDGTWVAYTNGEADAALVEVVFFDGSRRTSLSLTGPVTQPAWAPAATSAQTTEGTPAPTAGALGDTWQTAQMPVVVGRPVGRVEAVTAGGPGFVAVGRGCLNGGDTPVCEGVVWTSTDGTAWVRTPAQDPTGTGAVFATSGPEIGMFDVAAGAPGIVAIGYAARPDLAATIWFSSDNGVSWERAKIGNAGSTRVNAITWDGRQFVMVGEDRSQWDGTLEGMDKASARAAVWTSTDGYTFTRVPHSEALEAGEFIDTMEDPTTGGMNDVVAGPAGLVAVGSVCTAAPGGCKPMAWTSGDGISWERAAAMQAADDQAVIDVGLTSVAASDTGYIAVGAGWELMSPDGRTWERKGIIGDCLNAVTTIGKRFFATCQRDGWQSLEVFSDEGSLLPWIEVGDPLPGSVYNPAEWHFAATSDIAVAVGPAVETDEPMAMVSRGQ